MLSVFMAFMVMHCAGLTVTPASTGKTACVMNIDVCHHGGLASMQNVEFPTSAPFICTVPVFTSSYPPIPDQAVASADPGETFKPPKA